MQLAVLTVRQPWAWAIAAGYKTIENRSWPPPNDLIGQLLVIHAGKALDKPGVEECRQLVPAGACPDTFDSGAIIAVARLTHVITESADPWFSGPFGWVLTDATPIPPVECLGKLGIWHLPSTIEEIVMRQLQQVGFDT